MATEKPQDVSREPAGPATPKEVSPERDLRAIEASFDRAEELVDRGLDATSGLSDAAWQLTLAQWRLGRSEPPRRQWFRQLAMTVAAVATVAYLTYRLIWTLNLATVPAAAFSIALVAAELYACASLGLYFFQVWRLVEPPLRRPTPGRTVDVFVATYNEDVALLRGTLTACVDMDYPHTTYVLDDGARPEVQRLADSLGVRYLSRTDRAYAKAGNLNNALQQSDGEFIVIFDADHVPYRHYITRLIGYFDDPQMGFVQVPHTTYNLDNFMGRWKASSKAYWEDVRIFFEAVQLGKNRFGVACFCGSAAILRRQAIVEAGLFATETITEDMHTGMRINANGWKSIAVSEEMVVGLAPDDAATFASQRLRWGEGNLSVMAYDNPLTMKGLTFAGRLNYFASIISWTMGPARLVLYLTPLVMLLTGVAPVADMSLAYFTVVGCYLLTVWTAVKVASNRCGQLLGIEMAMMASFHLQLMALWRAVFHRRRQTFVVTRKRREPTAMGLRRIWPQAALVSLSIVAVSWAASRVVFGISDDYFGFAIGSGLAAYHSWLALTVMGRATAKRQPGEEWHHPLCLAVDYSIAGQPKPGVSVEFNENGTHLLTWEPLDVGTPLRLTFHSPVGETVCHGQVTATTALDGREPFGYVSNVVFHHADPLQRERDVDAIRRIILRYVVPVVTMTHRVIREEGRALPEELSGEGDIPMSIAIDANQPNRAVQKSIALSLSDRGFLAALETPCPIGNQVRVTLNTPLGTIQTEAEVHDVDTMRVGAALVHQHEFHWRDGAAIRNVVAKRRRWASALNRTVLRMRTHRQPRRRVAVLQAAACLLAALTVFVYGQFHFRDILLAIAANQPMTADERDRVETALVFAAESPTPSSARLLRIYEAAAAIGDHDRAAEAAKRLADRGGQGRIGWMVTQARQLAQTTDHSAADAAFDRVLAERLERELPLDQLADVYVEAARAAIANNNLDKAVDRFLKASSLKAADPEQAEELLGALIAAKRTQLSMDVLRQLDRTDRVLRRIVDVNEMAQQPEKALPELEELNRRHPDDAQVVRRLAELAVVRRDFSAALGYYRSLWKIEPGDENVRKKVAETMLLLAREEVAARRFAQASPLFDESFGIEPADAKLKREYAGLLASEGRFDEAIRQLRSLNDAESQRQLAAVLEMQGDQHRALEILLRLESSNALDDKGQRSIARLLLADRQYEEAADRLARLIEKNPDDGQLQRELLDAVAASDHWSDPVRQTMDEVYRRNRESRFAGFDAEGFERFGDALRRLGRFDEAGVVLGQGVEQFPQERRLRFYLAQTLGSLGRYDDAEKQYRELLDTRPASRR